MDKIIISGGHRLKGKVTISGSKNAALPIIISSLLTDRQCMIENVPQLKDIDTAISLLEYFNKKVRIIKSKVEGQRLKMVISTKNKRRFPLVAPYELIKRMRASFLVSGPLVARYGKVKVSLPGGCAIGVRPVNIHLEGLKKLGVKIDLKAGYVVLKAKRLKGAKINLSYPSVGATENLMMAASLAEGETLITNAAREPEIVDLACFLNKIGAKITGAGSSVIKISGMKRRANLLGLQNRVIHKIIPDRIEAGTYLIAGAITRGDVTVENCLGEHVSVLLSKLKQAGLKITYGNNSIRCRWIKKLKCVDITTEPYPGFPTDLQAQWMGLMCIANGQSVIKENVFENRFLHVAELNRLGADLKIQDDYVIVNGSKDFSGAPVMVSDLRAGAALFLAGLAAKGETVISRVYHLDRGYENLEKKLCKLGAKIKRVK